ncbi:MAG: nascent polypeptide-associated complex subunit alpha [Amphiamblys sp. WSBS2006]|nr:MAG: nascent polypeptide-associated complex subunit alpha [Amphiamblys sp. WSBS2006]
MENTELKREHTRDERKAKKAMEEMKMKRVAGIKTVSIVYGGKSFLIEAPEVYKAGDGAYIILGAPAQNKAPSNAPAQKKELLPEKKEPEEEEKPSENEEDISVVMDQACVSREEAIKALAENDGDAVGAIMNLTV